MGRPKGTKSSGVPPISIKEAVSLVTKAFEKIGYNETSFKEMAQASGQPFGNAVKLFGHIEKNFGLLERTPQGLWKISDLGRRAAKGEKQAIKEAFEKNPIYRALSTNFWTRNVTVGAVETYLKANYKQGSSTPYITNKFIEAKNYLKKLEGAPIEAEKNEPNTEGTVTGTPEYLPLLIQLKYALNPPKKEEITQIVNNLVLKLKTDDATLNALVKQMQENKEDEQILKVLTNTIWDIYKDKYQLYSPSKKRQSIAKEKEPTSEDTTNSTN